MRLLLIRDKRPGHHNQVEGLAVAISCYASVSVQRIELKPRWPARGVLRLLSFRLLKAQPRKALSRMFGIDLNALPPTDAVLCSGRAGYLAAALIRQARPGVKSIHCGYLPREYSRADCDLMLVTSPRIAFEPRCVLAPIPTMIDAGRLQAPRPFHTAADLSGATASLLVGGKAKGYRYTAADWQAIVDLVGLISASGIRWSVSSSRRTPPDVADRFAALAAAGKISRFVDFRRAGSGSIADLYGADALVVTEDSRTMVAECIAAGRPTIIIRPIAVDFSAATEDIVALAASGNAAILTADGLGAGRFIEALLSLRPVQTDPKRALFLAAGPTLGLNQTGQMMPVSSELPSP